MTDKQMIITALKLWFRPGDVFEIRVLDAITAEYMRPHVESGYFDFEHIPHAADALEKLRLYRGAYATVNPVNPDLLGRAFNRLRAVGREPTTSDTDILSRRWLLIDCDARRPAGISSSDSEHEAALAKAKEISAGLASLGWPEPVMTDSGNGAQLMYHIELPADDGGLVQKCLDSIALASSDQVEIDTTVHNPARIWRIPGTMNCKGDSIPARPHRMARILSVPQTLKAVTPAQMQTAASWKKAEQPIRIKEESRERSGFDLDAWIRRYCPELGAPQVWKDGRKWVFPVCPFNDAHRNRSAVLIQEPSGAIAFRCHHNGCVGNDWRKLRELKEPGCYDATTPDLSVDLSGILKQKPKSQAVEPQKGSDDDEPPWHKITCDDIRKALKGTYLGHLADVYASVTRPTLPLEAALLKAVATAAACLTSEATAEELARRYGGNIGGFNIVGIDRARVKIDTGGGQICNAYAMLVGDSSSGKDIGGLIGKFMHMLNPHNRRAHDNFPPDYNLGTGGSPEGIAKILVHKPNGILSLAEMSAYLDKNTWQGKSAPFLTEIFNQGFFDLNFSDRGRGGSSRSSDYCAPTIITNIQPDVFPSKVDIEDICTGFAGRFLYAIMPSGFYGNPAKFDSIETLKKIQLLISPFQRKIGVIDFAEGYSDDLQKIFIGHTDKRLIPSWRRLCNEYYPRFVVMLSVTDDPATQGENVIVTDETHRKARLLVLWFFANAEQVLLSVMETTGNDRIYEKKLLRIFRIVRDYDRGVGVLTSAISRAARDSGTDSKQRQDLLNELVRRGWIKQDNNAYFVDAPPPDLLKRKNVRK